MDSGDRFEGVGFEISSSFILPLAKFVLGSLQFNSSAVLCKKRTDQPSCVGQD